MKGLLLFAKYAFPPNQLQYCGPQNSRAIFDYIKFNKTDLGLRELLSKFEGALPYLTLIAKANSIQDPFDQMVVEAYWIGNELLDNVGENEFAKNLSDRFKNRIKSKDFQWLMTKLPLAGKPYHAFHVFDVFTRAGLLRNKKVDNVIDIIDKCRISQGKIVNISENNYVVKYQPLKIIDGKLKLSDYQKKNIFKKFDGSDILSVKIGDIISIHWDWACDKLTNKQKINLTNYTKKYLDLANLTI